MNRSVLPNSRAIERETLMISLDYDDVDKEGNGDNEKCA